MKGLVLLTILFIIACSITRAQDAKKDDCPTISVTGPAGIVNLGEIGTYTAKVTDADRNTLLKYRWSTSAGEIVKGQGTSTVSIKFPDSSVTVTVEVEGLPKGCSNVASETEIWDLPPQPRLIAETSTADIPKNSFKEIADNSKQNPNSLLYILSGHPHGIASSEIQAMEQKVLGDLFDNGVDRDQMELNGVYSEKIFFQFWLVPPGADLPRCKECEELENLSRLCPTISVTGPAGIIDWGKIATFSAEIQGVVPANVSYLWTISKGEIVSGQGTLMLQVRVPETYDMRIIGTIEVRGLPPGCPNTASEQYACAIDSGPILLSEYGKITISHEYKLIAALVAEIKKRPNNYLCLILYPTGSAAAFNKRKAAVEQYLTRIYGERNFKVIVGPDTGMNKTKIFDIPPGVDLPQP